MKRLVVALLLASLVVALAMLWISGAVSAAPEARIALVIGNSQYGPAIGSLKNPANDAALIGATLRRVGFDTTIRLDVDRKTMKTAIADFAKKLREAGPGAVGLFYFAGHGLSHDEQNWLVPTSAEIEGVPDIEDEAIRASYVLDYMALAHNALNILILDACRNNPFKKVRGSTERGLRAMDSPTSTFIGFATAPGAVADDGPGKNSPYALALAGEIGASREPIEVIFRRVRERVLEMTGGKQRPYYSPDNDHDFRFVRQTAAPPPPPVQRSAPAGGAPSESKQIELLFWDSIRNSKRRADFEAYLKKYPNGEFADLARNRLNELTPGPIPLPPPVAQNQTPTQVPPVGTGGAFRDCAGCPEMVALPAGQFLMGSPTSELGHAPSEAPQHAVSISRKIAVAKFEVTFAEWDACVAAGGCKGYRPDDRGWGRDSRPVINVTWVDAQSYVEWISQQTRKRYRLLTEAEWEYAARAGTQTAFPWGATANHDNANFGIEECCGGAAGGRDQWLDQTAPSGSFPANKFGLYDMHGNVWEWVQDCWNGSYVNAPSDGTPWFSNDCSRRLQRGGSWNVGSTLLRSAGRNAESTSYRSSRLGFRVARDL